MVPSLAAVAGAGAPLFSRRTQYQRSLACAGWCHPIRGSGIMVTRNLFGFVARAKGSWCGRRDLNPHGPCGPTDFHTLLRLSPPPTAFAMGFGVWTIPSPCPDLAPGVRCCRSSLYTFPAVFGPGLARDCHVTGFPGFEQFCIAGFPASTQVYAQVRCVCRFRHARLVSRQQRMNN